MFQVPGAGLGLIWLDGRQTTPAGAGGGGHDGHGTGAMTATNLAAQHPDRIVGVVLVDGGLPIDVLGDRHAVAEATLLPIQEDSIVALEINRHWENRAQ